MIIIGEKINGSIPSVARAIEERDADRIRNLAKIQSDAGADYIDVCAAVEESRELETLEWLIGLVREMTDVPVCIDSPSASTCVAAMRFCSKPGIINSVSGETGKIDAVFPVIADTEWSCAALLCDDRGIPKSAARRLEIFENIIERAFEFGIAPSRLFIDPLVATLGTDGASLTNFTAAARAVKERFPDIHITSGLSNVSVGLPVRKMINMAFMVLAMGAGMDSAIADPTNRDLMGLVYAADALLERDECCMEYIAAFRNNRFGPLKTGET